MILHRSRAHGVRPVIVWLVVLAALAHESLLAEPGEIRVLPAKVYPAQVYRLRIEGRAAPDSSGWKWQASAGELLGDASSRVLWESPEASGKVRIGVTAPGEQGKATDHGTFVDVEVHSPSRDGMALVPAGTFVMGDSWTDTENPYFIPTFQNMTDKPAHRVYLDSYWIDRHRVTNRQYVSYLEDARTQGLVRVTESAVIGWHDNVPGDAEIPFYYFEVPESREAQGLPEILRRITWDGKRFGIREGHEDHAVMDVTWAGARAYALFYGRRLPSEAEWEKASRGTDARRFPWGNEAPTAYHAHVNAEKGRELVPVGSFSPTGDSAYGVADLFGGFEWVNDWFGEFYYHNNYSLLPIENPRGPEWGRDRPVRGISVYQTRAGDEYQNPLSFRYQWIFEFDHGHLFAHSDTGFRTALSAPERGAEELKADGLKLPEKESRTIPRPRLPERYDY